MDGIKKSMVFSLTWNSKTIIVLGTLITVLTTFHSELIRHFQQIWEASGDFWQSLWSKFIVYFGEDDFKLIVYGTTLWFTLLYWGWGFMYIFLDLTNWPKFLRKYKVQPGTNEPVAVKDLIKVSAHVMVNHVCLGIPFRVVLFYVMKWRGLQSSYTLPTFHRILLDHLFCLMLGEITFYCSHRLLHHRSLYKYIHKKHHEWTSPIAITSNYSHPIEYLIVSCILQHLGLIILGSHVVTLWFWMILCNWSGLVIHSGYHIPGLPSPEFHDYHHAKFNVNFGSLGILDVLLGTSAQHNHQPNNRKKKH